MGLEKLIARDHTKDPPGCIAICCEGFVFLGGGIIAGVIMAWWSAWLIPLGVGCLVASYGAYYLMPWGRWMAILVFAALIAGSLAVWRADPEPWPLYLGMIILSALSMLYFVRARRHYAGAASPAEEADP